MRAVIPLSRFCKYFAGLCSGQDAGVLFHDASGRFKRALIGPTGGTEPPNCQQHGAGVLCRHGGLFIATNLGFYALLGARKDFTETLILVVLLPKRDDGLQHLLKRLLP